MERYLERIIERRKTRGEIFRKGLRDEALKLVRLLIDNGFRFKRIYLFGSSIKEKPLAPWSDIDLDIEGLNQEVFYKVYAFLLKNSRYSVDLKPLEDLSDPIRERIKKEGMIIYEGR